MKVILFGATGMVGQGVLRECLLSPDVQLVQTIGRTAVEQALACAPKLQQIAHADLWNYSTIEAQLSGFDACFFCLGVASAGMAEADYERVTYGITMAAAETLVHLNPGMTFVFVSGAGTDSSEQGSVMWARIKGKTENALMRLPFKAVYAFRPGVIQPLHGIRSKTTVYRVFYSLTGPVLPLLRWAFPGHILTTGQIGQAMLKVAASGAPKQILESRDIYSVVAGEA